MDDLQTALFLGILQGLVEWLPVSSEGVVAAAYGLLLDRPLDEAVAYALWLHLGTSIAALVAFRGDVLQVVRELPTLLRAPSPFFRFLFTATLVSAVTGLPLLLLLGEVSTLLGNAAMLLVGVLMLVTGVVLLRRPLGGTRGDSDLTTVDGILTGVVQGLAALPGLSRSGLTVAMLLGRRVDRTQALRLSFLLSIPASLGVSLIAGLDEGVDLSVNAFVGVVAAGVVGLVTIKALMAVAQRVNFGVFVLTLGALVIAGTLWVMLAS
ncbi:MAG: undecaprenyl-diphosphate phosphatase [Chloroflexi bacterium]|nr:undecaprenyl-diphosphate phosphatase [Chloroflexota bacterium]